jgi:hypothetical protein
MVYCNNIRRQLPVEDQAGVSIDNFFDGLPFTKSEIVGESL